MFRSLDGHFNRVNRIWRVPVRPCYAVSCLQAVDKEAAEKVLPLPRKAAAKDTQELHKKYLASLG